MGILARDVLIKSRSIKSRSIKGGPIKGIAHRGSLTRTRSLWAAIVPVAIATSSLLSSTMVYAPPALSEEHTLRVLTVTGQGTETIPTTLAVISLAVEVTGPTAEAVQQDMAQRSADLVEFLNTQSIDNLTTTGIYLSPRYDYQDDGQRLIGYSASNTIQFEITTAAAGELLDGAVQAGATRIDGIQFRATDGAIATAQRQALRAATLDAQEQADVVLSALGFSRQDIIGVQVNHANAPFPPLSPFLETRAASLDSAPSTPVIGSDQEVAASVTLQIQY